MRVVVDTLIATPNGLICGSVIHYQEGGPVRFVQIEIPMDLFDWAIVEAIIRRVSVLMDETPQDEALF
jgi:hypothetical protein